MSPTDRIFLWCDLRKGKGKKMAVSVCISKKCPNLDARDGEFFCLFGSALTKRVEKRK